MTDHPHENRGLVQIVCLFYILTPISGLVRYFPWILLAVQIVYLFYILTPISSLVRYFPWILLAVRIPAKYLQYAIYHCIL